MASLPPPACAPPSSPHLKGQGGGGLPSLCNCQKGTQETKVCCPPLSSLQFSSGARPVPGLLPLLPPRCHFGQQGRFLLGRQRSQTAEILKASYFSSKHISPHLEALELPWDIPDITLTFCCPSIWNPSGPGMLMSLPAGETKSFCSGWGFAHSLIPRPPRAPRKSAPRTDCPTPAWPELGRAAWQSRHFLAPNTHASSSLKRLSCLEWQKKKKKKSLFGVV